MVIDLAFDKVRITALRERLGLSQRAFAKELGVTQGAVSLWESGERTPHGGDVLAQLVRLESEAAA